MHKLVDYVPTKFQWLSKYVICWSQPPRNTLNNSKTIMTYGVQPMLSSTPIHCLFRLCCVWGLIRVPGFVAWLAELGLSVVLSNVGSTWIQSCLTRIQDMAASWPIMTPWKLVTKPLCLYSNTGPLSTLSSTTNPICCHCGARSSKGLCPHLFGSKLKWWCGGVDVRTMSELV